MNFSVLISVYYKEKPECLNDAITSIFNQTLLPNEVILVEDGKLIDELYDVIKRLQEKYNDIKTVCLKENKGLGPALNEGLKYCSYDIVARMDSDDICMPDRFRIQTDFLEKHPNIDIVSGWIDEFYGNKENIISTRKIPEKHNDIVKFGKSRNPINHPATMFRKSIICNIGGYRAIPFLEDYDLWVRAILNGAHLYNIQQSLLWFRLSDNAFLRRGGIDYAKNEIKFQQNLYKIGYISIINMYSNIFIRLIIRLLPNMIRKYIYVFRLRK